MNPLERLAALSGLCIVVVFAAVILWIMTIVDIMRSDFKKDIDKTLWFLLVLLIPVIGFTLYFFIGRFQKEDAEYISKSKRYRHIGRDDE